MLDLIQILNNAATSMAAQRALSAVAGNNVQNANTPGYARQRANLTTVSPAESVNGAYIGRGAMLQSVEQIRDRFVEAQVPQALGNAAGSAAESQALAAFHALDPGATGGLAAAISGFSSALSALAQNAGDGSLRASFLGAARNLATAFQRTAQAVVAAQSGLDAKLGGVTDQVNAEARAVADLNAQIRKARVTGAEPNDLLDQRQQHLDRLSELAGATTVATSDGDINVVMPRGQALVVGFSAARLQLVPVAGGHPAPQLTASDGSVTRLANADLGGTAGGVLAARDGALADVGAGVDQLAFELAGALNTAHQAGTGLDGSSGLPLFSGVATQAGAASSIAVALTDPRSVAASLDGSSGDARNAQALLTALGAPLPGGSSVEATLGGLVAAFGSRAQQAASFAEQDQAIQAQVAGLRDSASGVSIDEELVKMQQAQRGYEAIAKVIQTADAMLQTLMDLKR